MQLSADQLRDFDEQGYLFFPNCFSEEEIALLRDDAEAILKLDRQEVWREKTGAPRTAFAAHTFNETFRLSVPKALFEFHTSSRPTLRRVRLRQTP
jgi:ectoine hydroxylase